MRVTYANRIEGCMDENLCCLTNIPKFWSQQEQERLPAQDRLDGQLQRADAD